MSEQYDLIVIGGGPGGVAAAQKAAAENKSVLVIEKEGWGGTCANRGCIPTKALLTCSKHYTNIKKFKRLGINTSEASIDFTAIKRHQQQAVKIAALGAHKTLADAQVETRFGLGKILSPQEIEYKDREGNTKTFTAKNIIIAWGAKPQILPEIELSGRILTSDGLLNLENLPGSIIIVGASVIGVEFATFFAELGVKVTLIELMERILPYEDQETAELLRQELTRLGVSIHTSANLKSLADTGSSVAAKVQTGDEQFDKTAAYALLCTGRQPLLNAEELNKLNIDYSKAGIKVDSNMMTNIAGIYAVGDVTGGMLLAHRAAAQGEVAANHICAQQPATYNENHIPSVIYSHPQIARVGNIQQSAGIQIIKSEYSANIVARMELINYGFAKAFFQDDKIIGATIVGNDAGELIVPLALAVSNEMTKTQLRNWVIPHPALGEIFAPFISG
ncbi:MAG TPA: dihydrolipoyl dehydrogenase [Deltaproteobacteria bacterium]|nr:dihydrolipoyl dehydrogenase [Deltaproteobacteria bacterium]